MRAKRQKICPNFIPREVTIIILSKLPWKVILRCKVVCKEWLKIVTSEPIFAKTQYEKNSMARALVCPKAIMDGYKEKSKGGRGWFYKLDRFSFDSIASGFSWDDQYDAVNSCKGFLLMERRFIMYPKTSRAYGVYNPLTKEMVFIRRPKLWEWYTENLSCGLGFSRVTKQFKVVVFVHDTHTNVCTLQIYTLGNGDSGTGKWRKISLPKSVHSKGLARICREKQIPIELNGVLHWQATSKGIACFDVENEELSQMLTPASFGESGMCLSSIGVYGGLLCLGITVLGKSRVEMWVMKEYGMKDSWMQYVVVKEALASKSIYGPKPDFKLDNPKLVEILESGEMIFLSGKLKPWSEYRAPSVSYHLFSYDPIKECFEKLKWLSKEYSKITIDLYTPSFCSIKDSY